MYRFQNTYKDYANIQQNMFYFSINAVKKKKNAQNMRTRNKYNIIGS